MNNKDFMKKFITEKDFTGAYCHLYAMHNELVNYSTTLCTIDHEAKTARLNWRKYSTTTSKIQGQLAYLLHVHGYTVTKYDGDDATLWNCGYVGAPTWKASDLKDL